MRRITVILAALLIGVMMTKQDLTVEAYYGGEWNDLTYAEKVYARTPVTISHGRTSGPGGDTNPDSCAMTLDNRDGSLNPANPASDLYGVGRNIPLRTRLGASDYRCHVEAASWKPDRAIKGDAWVDLAGYGTLSRLTQGDRPVLSCPRRYLATTDPDGYWPLEDGQDATAGKAAAGDRDMQATYTAVDSTVTFGRGVLAGWLLPGMEVHGSVVMAGASDPGATPTSLTTDLMRRAFGITDTSGGATYEMTAGGLSGGNPIDYGIFWVISGGVATLELYRYDEVSEISTTVDTATTAVAEAGWDDAAHHWRIDATQNGADVDLTVYLDGTSVMSGTHTSATLVRPTVTITTVNTDKAVYQHAVWWADSPPAVADAVDAAFGHPGECAGTRFLRVCDLLAITATIDGTETDTQLMGPQHPDTDIDLLKEIERTDNAVIYDARSFLGLTMRTGRSRYNQVAALELDFTAGEVSPPLTPIIDDAAIFNDITATRRSGATARAVAETGPNNTSAPTVDPRGVNPHPRDVKVNPSNDDAVDDHASWHRHAGTVDAPRWSAITVDVDAAPHLVDAVSAVAIGDRITVASPPVDYTPDTIDVHVIGIPEVIGTHSRVVTFVTEPTQIWTVGEYAAGGDAADCPCRYNPQDSQVQTAFVAGVDTALVVEDQNGGTDLWSTTASGFDIRVRGVRLRVTAVGAPTGAVQTLTVAQDPINGVRKTIPVGSPVELWAQARYAL